MVCLWMLQLIPRVPQCVCRTLHSGSAMKLRSRQLQDPPVAPAKRPRVDGGDKRLPVERVERVDWQVDMEEVLAEVTAGGAHAGRMDASNALVERGRGTHVIFHCGAHAHCVGV